MKLLFVHDHPFYLDGEVIYSGGGLPYTVWDNYLLNFNKIAIFARRSLNVKDKKVVSSTSNVTFHLTEKYSSVGSFIRNIGKIKEELNEIISECDVVLARLPSILGLLAANEALKHKKPLWIEQVGNAKEAFANHGSIIGRLISSGLDYINRAIVRKANFISYVTEYKLQADYPCNESAVSVALSDVIIRSVLDVAQLESGRFYSESLEIGLIGGFDARYKGQDILLRAVARLPKEIKNRIYISLVGKGDFTWLSSIIREEKLESNIKFIGPLESGNEVDEFLKRLSLYVQPSLTEGMPRAIIEAMAMGCPVIGSKVGGIPDVVSDDLLHFKKDVDSLSKHIQILFTNRELLFEQAVSSLRKVKPYVKSVLDKKRDDFYTLMNKKLHQYDS